MLEIIEAKSHQMPLIRDLFLEYANTLDFDLSFQGFADEIASLPGAYSLLRGCLFLAFKDSEPAGCVGIKSLDQETCEMKRLYVRPNFQSHGFGRALVLATLEKAIHLGYRKIRLDTVPTMKSALELYRSLGFYSIPAYRENPVPGAMYLEKNLFGM